MILDIAVFFGVLAVLVLAHEFGHFIAARRSGVKVEEFGFGFPPRLFSFKKGETLYSLNLLPLGGFVKIAGENETQSSEPGDFASKSKFVRAKILSAGVFFNVILAFIIFSFAVFAGIPVDADDSRWSGRVGDKSVTVIEVLTLSAAEKAGIIAGDKILSLRAGESIIKPSSVSEVQEFTRTYAGGETVNVLIERRGEEILLGVNLDESGDAPLGVALGEVGKISVPWYAVPLVGLELTVLSIGRIFAGIFFLVQLLFSGASVAGMVSGPVGIYSIVASAFDFGIPVLMSLAAVLSVNLAVINLIPIPGLDGGRLLFLGIEAVRGKAINQKASNLAHALGFAILILLIVVITYYDIKTRF